MASSSLSGSFYSDNDAAHSGMLGFGELIAIVQQVPLLRGDTPARKDMCALKLGRVSNLRMLYFR